jgi:uncharacterized coiled-coil protein SlyX
LGIFHNKGAAQVREFKCDKCGDNTIPCSCSGRYKAPKLLTDEQLAELVNAVNALNGTKPAAAQPSQIKYPDCTCSANWSGEYAEHQPGCAWYKPEAKPQEPREYWIHHDKKVLASNRRHWADDPEMVEIFGNAGDESLAEYKAKLVHVIEKSAYDAVVYQLEEAKIMQRVANDHAKKVQTERDQLRTDLAQSRDAYEMQRKYNEQLQATIAEQDQDIRDLQTQMRHDTEELESFKLEIAALRKSMDLWIDRDMSMLELNKANAIRDGRK